jgi:translation initiation factor 1 (eIF-1/SUI1)
LLLEFLSDREKERESDREKEEVKYRRMRRKGKFVTRPTEIQSSQVVMGLSLPV